MAITTEAKSVLAFEDWKKTLHEDCQKQGQLLAFDAMGDSVLELLWQIGLEPTVEAIVNASERARTELM